MEKAGFYSQDGKEHGFYLIMDTVVSGNSYVLASETDPDEGDPECFILKKTGEDGQEDIYEPVEDDDEFMAVYDIFIELLEDE